MGKEKFKSSRVIVMHVIVEALVHSGTSAYIYVHVVLSDRTWKNK